MPRPIILISSGRTLLPVRGDDAQSTKVGSDEHYVSAVIRAGGAPLLLPPHGDKEATRAAVSVADALLLSGGGDIHSLVYGAQPHPKSFDQDPARDATELLAVDFALKKRLPILGICRGCQLLNVAFGGDLIQHIPGGDGWVKHESQGMAGLLLHTVELESGTLLRELFPVDSMAVNSFHHQAPGRVGEGLRVAARATDGTIEALEAVDGRAILGVTFHPEESAPFYPAFDAVFKWLISKARKK